MTVARVANCCTSVGSAASTRMMIENVISSSESQVASERGTPIRMKKWIGIVNSTTKITEASVSSKIPRMNQAAINSATTMTAINTQRVVVPPAELEVN